MDEQRIEAAATFWVVERFEDGNGRSLGYWTGHNSRDFTPNIIDAMQFVRRDDALLAKSPWHWRDCEATEHKFIGVRAASPHLAQDEGLRKAAQDVVEEWSLRTDWYRPHFELAMNALKAALTPDEEK